MRLVLAALAGAVLLAGCGGGSGSGTPPTTKRLPHALAQQWAGRADSIASAVSAGNSCHAQKLAEGLRDDVIGAESRVPLRYRSILLAAVNELADRITCVPPATTVTVPAQPTPHPHPGPKPKPAPKPKKPHGHGGH